MKTIYYTTTPDYFGTSESQAFFDLSDAKEWGEESTAEDIGDYTGDETFSYVIEIVRIPIADIEDVEDVEDPYEVLQAVNDWGEYVADVLDIEVGHCDNFNVTNLVADVQTLVSAKLDIRKRYGQLKAFWGGYMQLPGFQIRIKDHTANPARIAVNDLSFVISGTNMGTFNGGDVEIFEPTRTAEDIAAAIIEHIKDNISKLLDGEYVDIFEKEELKELKEKL